MNRIISLTCARLIAVRSYGLSSRRCLSDTTDTQVGKSSMLKHLKQKILFRGPITVAEYMKEVLTNSFSGYYMHSDVFGVGGDFITSPEISQMFGELIAVWCVNEWIQSGSPDELQIVEFGPGRGTLADDMLRVFVQFPGIRDAVSLHLIEVSPHLSGMQLNKLANKTPVTENNQNLDSCYRSCVSRYNNIPVYWYKQLADVPKRRSVFIAHEFFDALPVHKFQKVGGCWREVLIDIDESDLTDNPLRFVLAPAETAASKLLLNISEDDKREHVEICPDAGTIITELSTRISEFGGYSLIADYGHSGTKTDTFRAFRQHKLFDPLSDPGTADLTADVDFSYLKRYIAGNVKAFGPVTQEHFLHSMGIGARLQVLLERANMEQRSKLISGYDMLTNPEKMGERFKFLAILEHRPELEHSYVPAGFC